MWGPGLVVGGPWGYLAAPGELLRMTSDDALAAASASLAWCPPYAWDFDPLERLNVVDWGDVYFDSGRPHEAPDAITDAYAGILAHMKEKGIDPKFVNMGVVHPVACKLLANTPTISRPPGCGSKKMPSRRPCARLWTPAEKVLFLK